MSGFLGHLAARAMGGAGSVHSVARLPYAAAPMLIEAAGDAATVLGPAPQSAPFAGALLTGAAQSPAPHGSPPQPAGTADAGEPAIALRQVPGDGPAPLRVTSPDLGRTGREAPEVPWGAPATPAPLVAPAMRGVERTIPAQEESEPRDMQQGAMPHFQPLLPLQRAPSRAAQIPVAAVARGPDGPARRGAAEESREVHVSIGRIEVTAVHDAPTPNRAQPRARRALSLEEYLARRQAGRS
jgi:hypothetical protein